MSGKCLRILIVEDHRDTREILVFMLTGLGHWVESCSDGQSALARMSHDGLDVLLTDVWLPDMDGFSYLAELARAGTVPPRVISMSAGDEVVMRQRSRQAGCAAHLVKPFKVKELESLLASF